MSSCDAASTRLVCLPHAGGSVSAYYSLARRLDPGIEVCAVQYPGRQDRHREPVLTDLHLLADRIAEHVSEEPGRSLALFGHSMGALLAYEVATRLTAWGRPPRALFVSGRAAPTRPVPTPGGPLHLRPEDDIVAEVTLLGGTAAELLATADLRELILPGLRGDYQAIETYRYRPAPPLAVPIHVYVGDADPRVTPEQAGAWAAHTSAECTVRTFDGGHFYLQEHEKDLAADIDRRLTALRPN